MPPARGFSKGELYELLAARHKAAAASMDEASAGPPPLLAKDDYNHVRAPLCAYSMGVAHTLALCTRGEARAVHAW